MYIKVLTWLSMTALVAAMAFWSDAPKFQVELNSVVTIAAAVVLIRAVQTKKYRWAVGFLGMAMLFNPAMPFFRLAGGIGLSLVVLSIALFAISLVALKPHPLLSMPSITDRNPGSQSL